MVLRDEAGGHVSRLELRVARKTQQKVNVGVQAYDLQPGDRTPASPAGRLGVPISSGLVHVYIKRIADLRCTAVNNSAASLRRQICPLPKPRAWRSSGHSEPTPHPLKTGTQRLSQRLTGGSLVL